MKVSSKQGLSKPYWKQEHVIRNMNGNCQHFTNVTFTSCHLLQPDTYFVCIQEIKKNLYIILIEMLTDGQICEWQMKGWTEEWTDQIKYKLENVFVKHYAPNHMFAPKDKRHHQN